LLDKLFLSNPAETHTDRLRQMISRRWRDPPHETDTKQGWNRWRNSNTDK
jgi:hypothetical protein